ncbi:Hypothetical protein FKW44_025077 [Caligus rogercresseyi]|uniref:Uncharacterized protein n=1 Tax=Caligus rogercresseyi TaxID=217165 RepID=A0A7T8JTG5_CALRO|nr:Hypothetical protein FKW44_025077 [Caligus rogercresseyi]
MDTGDKRSEERIKVELRRTFSINKFKSYEELCGTKWEPGTPVEVYLTRIRTLMSSICEGGVDSAVKVAFVMDLPPDVSSQLQATPKIESMKLLEALDLARGLLSMKSLETNLGLCPGDDFKSIPSEGDHPR